MAPQLKADAGTVSKMLDITRTTWTNANGIEITPEALTPRNGRPNKHPKANVDIKLQPFKLPGMEEETTRIFIADPWPTDAGWEEKELLRRQVNGQGVVIGHTEIPLPGGGVKLVDIFHPRKKRWTRTDRRVTAAIGRSARRRNEISARKPVKKLRSIGKGKGPSPRNPANKTKQKEVATA